LIDWLLDCGHERLVAEVAELGECGVGDHEFDRIRFDCSGFWWGRLRTDRDWPVWSCLAAHSIPMMTDLVTHHLASGDLVDLLRIVATLLGRRYFAASPRRTYVEFYS
jgi:hypothetical protein